MAQKTFKESFLKRAGVSKGTYKGAMKSIELNQNPDAYYKIAGRKGETIELPGKMVDVLVADKVGKEVKVSK